MVQSKAWVCISTCIGLKAIQLEPVEDITTAQFLGCLRRFFAGKGKSNKIISDNAQSFKVRRMLLTLHRKTFPKILVFSAMLMNVESNAPWSSNSCCGWKSSTKNLLVISVTKMAIRKSIRKLCLTSIQLQTILNKIKAAINRSMSKLKTFAWLQQRTRAKNHNNTNPLFYELTQELDLRHWWFPQKHFEYFWKIWKDDYLVKFRERIQIYKRHPRIQSSQEPWLYQKAEMEKNKQRKYYYR